MQIRDLYEKYQIMPQLAKHQLRVGGIVKLITDDRKSIQTALVHDMGNIVKFTGLDSEWSKVQKKYWEKYGKDAHVATIGILEDARLTKLKQLVEEEANFYNQAMYVSDFTTVSLPASLTLYADTRVMPKGVVSLEERILDLETRYPESRRDKIWGPRLEAYVQSLTKIDIRAIKESDVEPLFDELLEYQL